MTGDTKITIALVGNPNCGKTTLFNLLTKSGEAVGNRAGVTFSPKKEKIRKNPYLQADIVDLPGIYSLFSNGNEEKATRRFLESRKFDLILNIIDATALERGLFLTLSLLNLGIPTVIALNMMDEAEKEGVLIDISALAKAIGVPVVPICAAKNKGIPMLLKAINQSIRIPPKKHFSFNSAEETFLEIGTLLSDVLHKKYAHRKREDLVDRFICRPFIGIPLFFLIMSFIFYLTFSGLGEYLTTEMDNLFFDISEWIRTMLLSHGVSQTLIRFLIDGIFLGVSSVVAFLPQTAILFCLLAILEDSGYMARVAFVMDRTMRNFGLSGKAVIPMLIGFGCSVPAVMATVTLAQQEKKNVLHSLPFIPCNARLPVLLFLVSTFFHEHTAIAATFFYMLSVLTAFLSSLIYARRQQNIEENALILELPKYRIPHIHSLLREIRSKLSDFMIRAGTVVFLSCVAVNIFSMLTPTLRITAKAEESILVGFGNVIAPLFTFLGFGNGSVIAALVTGFFAKESIVSTLHILFPGGITSVLSLGGAVSLTAFSMLYTPCVATLSAIRKECGTKTALAIFLRTLFFATVVSFLLYTLILLYSFLHKNC